MNKITLRYRNLIVPFLVVAVVLFISWVCCPIGFETNDDSSILSIVAGVKTGTPSMYTVHCNALWGYILSSLYRITDKIPWYILIYLFLNGIVLIIICYSCLYIFCHGNKDNNWLLFVNYLSGICVFLALFFGFLCYHFVLFQFTTVPAFCGVGAILLMCHESEKKKRTLFIFCFLICFSCIIRPLIGYLVTIAVVITYIVIKMNRGSISYKYLINVGLIQSITYIVNLIYEKTNNTEAFRRYHAARTIWMDYPHVSYSENTALYRSVGWNEQLFRIAEKWFFMDKRINAETFERLNVGRQTNVDISLIEKMRRIVYMFRSDARIQYMSLLIIGVILVLACYLFYKHRLSRALSLLVVGFLAFSLLAFFAYRQRLQYRVAVSIVSLLILPVLFWVLKDADERNSKGIIKKTIFTVLIAGGIVILSITNSTGLMHVTYKSARARKEQGIIRKAMDLYASERHNNIYIYDLSLALCEDPFFIHKEKPYNLFFWGGSGMYSPVYYEQLKANGMTELYSDCFFSENVFFMSKESPSDIFLQYLESEYGSISLKNVEEENGFIVYQLEKSSV